MSGETAVLNLLQQQQEENNRQFESLRKSNEIVAKAVATLATTMARVEERHVGHDAGMKRLGAQVDDHEARIRVVEATVPDPKVLQDYEVRMRNQETTTSKALGGALVISILIPVLMKLAGAQ